MTANEFIKESIATRIAAVKILAEKLIVNNVNIAAYPASLEVYSGINELAEMFDAYITSSETINGNVKTMTYKINVEGVDIIQRDYTLEEGAKNGL